MGRNTDSLTQDPFCVEESFKVSDYRTDCDGGKHEGEYPVVIWSSCDMHPQSPIMTATYLNKINRSPHFVWAPFHSSVISCLPLDVAARGLKGELNNDGAPAIQIVITMDLSGSHGFLSDSRGLTYLLKVLRSFDIPDEFPLGPPSKFSSRHSVLQRFPKAGHYSGEQIDPSLEGIGQFNPQRLFRKREYIEDAF